MTGDCKFYVYTCKCLIYIYIYIYIFQNFTASEAHFTDMATILEVHLKTVPNLKISNIILQNTYN